MKAETLPVVSQPVNLPSLVEQKQSADNQIELAAHWAKNLMEVVRRCNMSKRVGGKEYLQVEAWLVIAEFAHCRAVAEECKPWMSEDGKELLGYTCRAIVRDQDGIEVGAGESSCGFDSFPCRGKQGSEQDKAAKGAAQTWAISRALSNRFRYVALMAGFQPTPREEMGPPDVPSEKEKLAMASREPPSQETDKPAPCDKHKTPWKVNNKGQYWHQVEGQTATCWLGPQLWDGFVKWAKVAEKDTQKVLGTRVWKDMTDRQRHELCAEMEEAARLKLEADQPPA